MAFRDQEVTCKECGKNFIYRVEEQRQQVNLGIEQIANKAELFAKGYLEMYKVLTGEEISAE